MIPQIRAFGGSRSFPHEEIAPEISKSPPEFDFAKDEGDGDAIRARMLPRNVSGLARQAAMDPDDGVEL